MKIFRLLELRLVNITSIEKGTVQFPECTLLRKDPFALEDLRGSFTGVYGQNGSGKTTILLSLSALSSFIKNGWIGRMPNGFATHSFAGLITKGKDKGSIGVTILIKEDEDIVLVDYGIELYNAPNNAGPLVAKETIEARKFDLDTNTYKSYLPALSIDYLHDDFSEIHYDGIYHRNGNTGTYYTDKNDIGSMGPLLGRKYSNAQIGLSFLFSNVYIQSLLGSELDKRKQMGSLLNALLDHFAKSVFFYGPKNDAFQAVGAGTLIGAAKVEENATIHDYRGNFPFVENLLVPKSSLPQYRSLTSQVNLLLGAAIPGFSLRLMERPQGKDLQGNPVVGITWFRVLGKGEIPVRLESNGIQKLIMLASAFVLASGNPSVWLFIDEFDSGVFEKLLSQLAKAFLETGKGQILFTAHNLRCLEVLPVNHVVFTTANPKNRFVTFKGLKPSNNLRDQYIRALTLGGQSEPLSKEPEIIDIERALYEAFMASQIQ